MRQEVCKDGRKGDADRLARARLLPVIYEFPVAKGGVSLAGLMFPLDFQPVFFELSGDKVGYVLYCLFTHQPNP